MSKNQWDNVFCCWRCLGEDYLSDQIRSKGVVQECSYCGNSRRRTFSMTELAEWFDVALQTHFVRVPSNYESVHDLRIEGDPLSYVLQEIGEIEVEIADQLCEALSDVFYDIELAKMSDAGLYDDDPEYAPRDQDDFDLQFGWKEFEHVIKSENRYFSKLAKITLDRIFGRIGKLKTDDGDSVIIGAGPKEEISSVFRCRVFHDQESLEHALSQPEKRLGSPPIKLALPGRMNAHGVSVFYGALNPQTALSEVRPPVGAEAVVAKFKFIRKVQLLDISALQRVYFSGSYFDRSHTENLKLSKFLLRLSNRITQPVMPTDEPLEYLITQAIADYLSAMDEPELDGIIFDSVQFGKNQKNIALFQKSSRIESIDRPEGTLETVYQKDFDPEYAVDDPAYDVVIEKPEVRDSNEEMDPFFASIANGKANEPDFYQYTLDNNDYREPTLSIDLENLTVKRVRLVNFQTDDIGVKYEIQELGYLDKLSI